MGQNKIFKGVIVPMVTPVNKDFSIDESSTEKLLNSFSKAGVAPFVLGTTGESTSLSASQKATLVKLMVKYTSDYTATFAGISGTCLSESIEQAKSFADMGVDQVVLHLPFYYPMSSDAMLRYFEQVADNISCPLVLYNNPITVKQSIPVEVIEKLSNHDNIVGIKDSERGLERLNQSLELWRDRKDFAFYLGWAAQSAYAVKNGADGIVPSTGNLTPRLYKELFDKAQSGNDSGAEVIQQQTNRISEIYQKDRNISQSIPALKVMMTEGGLCTEYVMPPLYQLEKAEQEYIRNLVKTEVLTEIK